MTSFLFGWKTGFEPATSGTTIQRSNQLSYNHRLIGDCKCTSFKEFNKELCILIKNVFHRKIENLTILIYELSEVLRFSVSPN